MSDSQLPLDPATATGALTASERRQLVDDALDEAQECLNTLLDVQARLPRLVERVQAIRDGLTAALDAPRA